MSHAVSRLIWVLVPLVTAAGCHARGLGARDGASQASMRYDPVTMDPRAVDSPATFKSDQDSLVAVLTRVRANRVTAFAWQTDHSFSDRRLALARTVVGWLQSSCGH